MNQNRLKWRENEKGKAIFTGFKRTSYHAISSRRKYDAGSRGAVFCKLYNGFKAFDSESLKPLSRLAFEVF